jgi:hypothetical protein
MAIHGFNLLRHFDVPQGRFENTTELVTICAYLYIRHLINCSLLLGAWGHFSMMYRRQMSVWSLPQERSLMERKSRKERENVRRFGRTYAQYLEQTARFFSCDFSMLTGGAILVIIDIFTKRKTKALKTK